MRALVSALLVLGAYQSGAIQKLRSVEQRGAMEKPIFEFTSKDAFMRMEHKPRCEKLDARTCLYTDGCLWDNHACQLFDMDNEGKVPYPQTCNDGSKMSECFNVEKCAEGAPGPSADARWAFIFSHSLQKAFPAGTQDTGLEPELVDQGLPEKSIGPLRDLAKRLGNTDLILMVPRHGALSNGMGSLINGSKFSDASRSKVTSQGVKVLEVPWLIPPGMKHMPHGGWCGPQDFMRFHMMGMEDYAAVAYFDTDTELTGYGDPTVPLRCAAKGHILTTGGVWGPLNIGYLALKPDRRVLDAAVHFARTVDFDGHEGGGTGWGSAGFAPNKDTYPGSECGQGFLHALLLKKTAESARAFQLAGVEPPDARVIDQCIWNHQTTWRCAKHPQDFDCKKIVMMHKEAGFCKKGSSASSSDRVA